jgi:hypothetical protein
MRYMQDPAKSWDLDAFNDLRGASFHRGDVILVPLVGLTLTEEGRSEARLGEQRTKSEGRIDDIEAQRKAEGEIPGLLEAVRRGRYVDAVARGNRVLGTGRLAGPQLARVHRALLEAYVALDTPEAAADACAAWKANEPGASLDPKKVSPKIRAACNEVPKP